MSGGALSARGGGDFDDGIGQSAHGAHENFDDGTVELRVGASFEFGERVGGRAGFFVGAVAGDGVVGVGDGDDARAKWNGFAGERAGVTGAVEKFVVMQDHFANVGERRERIENLRAKANV